MSRKLWVVLAVAFLARLGYGLRFPAQAPGEPLANPDNYVSLSAAVAETWSIRDSSGRPTAEREPLFIMLLGATFMVLGKNYAAILVLNAALGVGSLFLLYRTGRVIMGESSALAAAIIGSFYPPFIFYSALPMRETFMIFMGLAAVSAVVAARRRDSLRAFAVAGAVNGLAGLTNSTFLPFSLIMAPLGLLFLAPTRETFKKCAAYAAVLIMIYLPWPVRNQLMFSRWIVGSTAGAASTFYTYLIVPQEVGGTPGQDAYLNQDPGIQKGLALKLDPIANEQFFWKESMRWIGQHPFRYARLVAWRLFWDMWRLWPRPRAYAHSYSRLKLVSLLSDGWIIPLGFLGVILFRLRSPEALFPYFFVFSVSFTYSLIFTMLRYRVSLMPWLILFAGYCLVNAWEALRRRAGP